MSPGRARLTATAEFGTRVRARRYELGLTQEQLAERSEFHWTYVSSVERGERNVTLRSIVHLAVALELDPAELVSGLKPGDS